MLAARPVRFSTVLPGLSSLTPRLAAPSCYFDDRFYYGEGSGSLDLRRHDREGHLPRLRFRAAYRSYDNYFPSQEGWYYDVRARVVIPKVFGDGNLIALSPWYVWSDISGAVTNALVSRNSARRLSRKWAASIELYQALD